MQVELLYLQSVAIKQENGEQESTLFRCANPSLQNYVQPHTLKQQQLIKHTCTKPLSCGKMPSQNLEMSTHLFACDAQPGFKSNLQRLNLIR